MRILVVNVNTTESITEAIGKQAQAAASPGTEIVALTPRLGAESVEGNFESHLAAVAVMDAVRTHTEQFDVPVVDGISAAASLAESLVAMHLSTSRIRTDAAPRPKRITGWPITGGSHR
jgi:Asp/Glu/hydantoin racemase